MKESGWKSSEESLDGRDDKYLQIKELIGRGSMKESGWKGSEESV